MQGWKGVVLFCRCQDLSRLYSVLNLGALFWPCRPSGLVIWVLTTLTWFGLLPGCLIMVAFLGKDGDLIVKHMIVVRSQDTDQG